MDITVSRLNNRMVLQVPPELPLGLVFVVGRVQNLIEARENIQPLRFDLVDSGYRLRCQLSSRVANEVLLQEGDMVRAGGHLAFDTQAARYYLLARDLEIVPETSGTPTKMAPILADIKKRAEAAELVQPELPQWVKQLAPPEVQEELGLVEEAMFADEFALAGSDGMEMETGLSRVDMSEEMLAFLSEAIDSEEEIEITPAMLAQFLPLEAQEASPAGSPDIRPLSDSTTPSEEDALPAQVAEESSSATQEPAPPLATTAQTQPTPRPPATRSRNSNTFQNIILGVIAVMFFLMLIVVVLIAINLLSA